MQLVRVQSTNLAAVGYEASSLTLEVAFTNGTAYQYYAVPANVHQGLMAAPSKGAYLDQFVKRAGYRYARVR